MEIMTMNKFKEPKVRIEYHTPKTLCFVNDIELYAFDMVGSMMNLQSNEVIRGIHNIQEIIHHVTTDLYIFTETGLTLIKEFEQIPQHMKRCDINTQEFNCRVLVHKKSPSGSIYGEEVSIYEMSCILGNKKI